MDPVCARNRSSGEKRTPGHEPPLSPVGRSWHVVRQARHSSVFVTHEATQRARRQCVRCHLRYCNKTCQHDHWRRGHKQICKKIHRGGNAEQYYADKKYKEAVAAAVEACADDTIDGCFSDCHPT